MTGFKPGSSGIGSDRSANCATTTTLTFESLQLFFFNLKMLSLDG